MGTKQSANHNLFFIVILLAVITLFNILEFRVDGPWVWALIAATGLAVVAIFYLSHLSWEQVGLHRKHFKSGLRWGVWSLAIVAACMTAAYLFRSSLFDESRYTISWFHSLVTILCIIPIKTVIFEEFIFRGVLLGLLLRTMRASYAVATSSLLFGLWHIVSSINLFQTSHAVAKAGTQVNQPQLLGIIIAVVITTVGGVLFCILRLKSKSLLAPIIAHWSINGLGVFFALLYAA